MYEKDQRMTEILDALSEGAENKDLQLILAAVSLEVEMEHWERISSFAHAIADVQDKEVLIPKGITPPGRPTPLN